MAQTVVEAAAAEMAVSAGGVRVVVARKVAGGGVVVVVARKAWAKVVVAKVRAAKEPVAMPVNALAAAAVGGGGGAGEMVMEAAFVAPMKVEVVEALPGKVEGVEVAKVRMAAERVAKGEESREAGAAEVPLEALAGLGELAGSSRSRRQPAQLWTQRKFRSSSKEVGAA